MAFDWKEAQDRRRRRAARDEEARVAEAKAAEARAKNLEKPYKWGDKTYATLERFLDGLRKQVPEGSDIRAAVRKGHVELRIKMPVLIS